MLIKLIKLVINENLFCSVFYVIQSRGTLAILGSKRGTAEKSFGTTILENLIPQLK
jgi:hypothetical protein